jgi:hypothetical protein
MKISENKGTNDLFGDFRPACVFVELIIYVFKQEAQIPLLWDLCDFFSLAHLLCLVLDH